MRPVRLDLDGFATFRKSAVIDFTGVDYFALVGPTGAGKSTVIDAITFALYATVPRWDNKNMIAPALAPSAVRAVVRLIFDADGKRYAVAREVRRSGGKTSRVTMHTSRLELLHDPDDFGSGNTDVLAADSEVTGAVERLLGLSYNHFVTCVALPQGQFAEFLHATPTDRQEILASLLGHQFYETLSKTANAKATRHDAEVDGLNAALAGFDDATPQNVAALRSRAAQLSKLRDLLTETALPALDEAAKATADAKDTLDDLTAKQSALGAVTIPDDVADLDEASRKAEARLTKAQAKLAAAETASDSAAQAVTECTSRFELDTLAQQWAALTKTEAALPDLAAAAQTADDVLAGARTAAADALTLVEGLHLAAQDARALSDRAQSRLAAAHSETERLELVVAPAGVEELADSLTSLASRRVKVARDSETADASYDQAQAALDAWPADGALGAGVRAAALLAQRVRADLDARAARAATATADADARKALTEADAAQRAAETAFEQAQRSDAAGALRTHLYPGDRCPVCEQQVQVIPQGGSGEDLTRLKAAVEDAKTAFELAASEKSTCELALLQDQSARSQRLAEADGARRDLNAAVEGLRSAPSSVLAAIGPIAADINLDTENDTLEHIEQSANQVQAGLLDADRVRVSLVDALADADTGRRAAALARRELDRDDHAVSDQRRDAVAALNAARDTVTSLGAPAVDSSDLGAAWTQLAAWAREQFDLRAAALPGLTDAADAALSAANTAELEHAAANTALGFSREAEMAADRAQVQKSGTRDDALARAEQLRAVLAGRLDADAVAALLAELDALEKSAGLARQQFHAARAAERKDREAHASVTRAVAASRAALTSARDPLTRFSAPALAEGGLADAWNELARWAAGAGAALAADVAEAQSAVTQAASAYTAAVGSIADALAAADLDEPDVTAPAAALRSEAAGAVAAALAGAQTDARHAATRLEEREGLAARLATASENAKVAAALAALLRSGGFRAWLLESALTSLVSDASAILFDMSSGQFELRSSGKDLEVIDHNDADSIRPVRTLSGGETFQASLALALALSRQVADLAASGAAKLESIFLDEGFGTLDETSLDVVAGTLETLASSGERMVGVVTHVAALAAQIPVRFEVSRLGSTSTITKVST